MTKTGATPPYGIPQRSRSDDATGDHMIDVLLNKRVALTEYGPMPEDATIEHMVDVPVEYVVLMEYGSRERHDTAIHNIQGADFPQAWGGELPIIRHRWPLQWPQLGCWFSEIKWWLHDHLFPGCEG